MKCFFFFSGTNPFVDTRSIMPHTKVSSERQFKMKEKLGKKEHAVGKCVCRFCEKSFTTSGSMQRHEHDLVGWHSWRCWLADIHDIVCCCHSWPCLQSKKSLHSLACGSPAQKFEKDLAKIWAQFPLPFCIPYYWPEKSAVTMNMERASRIVWNRLKTSAAWPSILSCLTVRITAVLLGLTLVMREEWVREWPAVGT